MPFFSRRESGSTMSGYVTAFDTLQFLGLFSTFGIVVTAVFSSKIQRGMTWYFFMAELVVFCIAYLLIVGHQSGDDPPFGWCLFQAALIFAVPAMCAFSALAMVFQLYITMSASLAHLSDRVHGMIDLSLLAFPIFIFFLVVVEITAAGLANPPSVVRSNSGMFCTVTGKTSGTITAVLVVIAVLLMLICEGLIISVYIKRRRASSRLLDGDTLVSLPVIIWFRVTVAASSGGTTWTSETTSTAFLGVACLPLVTSVIFGSQEDMLRAWMFWKRASPVREPSWEPSWPAGGAASLSPSAQLSYRELVDDELQVRRPKSGFDE
ncbi:hypothetical protein C8J56DRAFT_1050532 [Mycena floridula]|nr:hypothetical protein C8J56DRAFT_1050532 [Mycena floridula]